MALRMYIRSTAKNSRGRRMRAAAVDQETGNLELDDWQKARLLRLGLEPDRPTGLPDSNEQKGNLLCDVLRWPPPLDATVRLASASDEEKCLPGSWTLVGPSLGDSLRNPKTDIEMLRRIKEYAKSLGQRAGSDIEKDVFLAVYFAAIAAAVLLHSKWITEHSDEDLIRFFDFFARSPWMPTDMADLFSDATRHRRNVP